MIKKIVNSRTVLLFFFLFLNHIAYSQVLSSKGTDFWFGFLEKLSATPTLRICISSDVASSGTISAPLAAWSVPFSVTPGNTFCVNAPENLMPTVSELILNTGIHIVSDNPVHVSAYNGGNASTDASIILPKTSVGNHYYVMSYRDLVIGGTTEFGIAAIENNTIIQITPSVATRGGQPAGVPFFVTLDTGQFYMVKALSGDLTGSEVKSCKNFAFFSGNTCTNIGPCTFCDHLYNQMYPVNTWGLEYISVPYALKAGDTYRIMACQDNTNIAINGVNVATINAGDIFETLLGTASRISGNKPISVAHFIRGRNCDGVAGSDPSMVILNSTDQLKTPVNKVTFESYDQPSDFMHYVNILTKTANTASIRIDGNIPLTPFTPVPLNIDYSYLQFHLATGGAHTIESDSAFFAIPHGYTIVSNLGESYAYMVSAELNNINPSNLSLSFSSTDAGCSSNDGTATVVPTGGTPPYTYSWNTTPVQTNDTAFNLDAGTYTATVTDAIGCLSSGTVTVNNTSGLSVSISGFTTCDGGNNGSAIAVPTSGLPPYTFEWNTTPVQTTDTAINLAPGSYTCTITDLNDCSISATVIISEALPLSVITLSNPGVTCNGENDGFIVVTGSGGNGPYTFSWNINPAQNNDTISGLPPGDYITTITDINGCMATDTITVTEPPALWISKNSIINVSCKGGNDGSAKVIGNGGTPPYTYAWNPSGGTNDSAMGLAAGTYSVEVTDLSNCSTDTLIILNEPDSLNLGVSMGDSICRGEQAALNASFEGGTPPYYFSWNPGTMSGPSVIITPSVTTTYTVTATDANNCFAAPQSVTIKVLASPVANFDMMPPQFASISDPLIHFNDQSTDAVDRIWNFGDALHSTSTLKNPSFSYSETGSFEVGLFVFSTTGCADSAYQTIQIESDFTFYIPNAFTPDNDGMNDSFSPKISGLNLIESYEMTIYNRWGEKIYHTTDIDKPWDGKYKQGSEVVKQDVYIYQIQVKLFEKGNRFYVGNVNLIR